MLWTHRCLIDTVIDGTELFNQDIAFFKKIQVKSIEKKNINRRNAIYDAFEEVVYSIGKMQLDMLNLSLNPSDDQTELKKRQDEVIKVEKKLSSLIDSIANHKGELNGCALKGLKSFVTALHERKQDENRKNEISDILKGKGGPIIKFLINIFFNLRNIILTF